MPRSNVLVFLLSVAGAASTAIAVPPAAHPVAIAPVEIPDNLDARVSAVVARTLATNPPLVDADASAIAAAVEKDLLKQALSSGLDPANISAAVEAARSSTLEAANRQIAYYSHGNRSILVQRSLLDALVAQGAIPAPLKERVLALATIRELARAVQDQEFPLAEFLRLAGPNDASFTSEAATVRRAVSEGHASATVELVGKTLAESDPAWNSALQAFERTMPGTSAVPLTDPAGTTVYRGGKRRLEGAWRAGGPAAAWALFSSPPSALAGFDLTLIAYDPDLSSRIAESLSPAIRQLGAEWSGKSMTNTPAAAFNSHLKRMTPEARTVYLGSIEGIASLAATSSNGTRIMLSVTKALDGPGADIAWEELGKMNAHALSTMPADPPSGEERNENGTLSIAARILMKNGPSSIPATMCRMRDGEWLVQISYLNGEPTFDRMREIGRLMLDAATRGPQKNSEIKSPPANAPTR